MNSTNSFDSRFCQSCQKNVIDFTQKSDSEIARTLKKEKNLCGRFRTSQLEKEYTIPTERNSWAIPSAIATLLALQTACTELEITHEVALKETVLVDFVEQKEFSEEKPMTETTEESKRETDDKGIAEFVRGHSSGFFMGDVAYINPDFPLLELETNSRPFWPRKRALEVSSPDYVPEFSEQNKKLSFSEWLMASAKSLWSKIIVFF